MSRSLDKAIKLCDSPVTEYRGYTIRKMDSGGGQIAATEKLKQLAKQMASKYQIIFHGIETILSKKQKKWLTITSLQVE